MIVHLFEDEKFVDNTINNFEVVSEKRNRYYVFSNKEELVYVNSIDKVEILQNRWLKNSCDLIFENCDLLVVHYLTPLKIRFIKNKPEGVPVVWSIWGKDAYDYFKDFQQYETLTLNLQKVNLKSIFKRTVFYDLYHFLKYGVLSIDKELVAQEKIDFIATVVPNEYPLITSEFKNLNAEFVKFCYDSSLNFEDTHSETRLGPNVLLGNSGTPSNNHLDVIEYLKQNKFNVVCPLSYGERDYINYIFNKGKDLLGERFEPLIEFMPFVEYERKLLSCNTMIMHHVRQQALGNVYLGLFRGFRVYLNKKSVVYSYLKDMGLIVFNLEDHSEYLGVELSEKEKEINRNLIRSIYGKTSILENTKNIVDLVER